MSPFPLKKNIMKPENSNPTAYDIRYDIIRTVAITLVIIIHSLQLLYEASTADGRVLTPATISYSLLQLVYIGVPLFVMLSGALLLAKEEPLPVFFKKRCVRLLKPFALWSCIVFAMRYTQELGGDSAWGYMKGLLHATVYENGAHPIYWYVFLIVTLYLFTPALRVYVHAASKGNIYFLLALMLAVETLDFCLPETTLLSYFPVKFLIKLKFFIGGYAIVRYMRHESWFKPAVIVSFITGYIIMIVNLWCNDSEFAKDTYRLCSLLTIGVFGLLFISIPTAAQCRESLLVRAVRAISRYSYGIYLTHFLFISAFLRFFPGVVSSLPICIEPLVMATSALVASTIMIHVLCRTGLKNWVC